MSYSSSTKCIVGPLNRAPLAITAWCTCSRGRGGRNSGAAAHRRAHGCGGPVLPNRQTEAALQVLWTLSGEARSSPQPPSPTSAACARCLPRLMLTLQLSRLILALQLHLISHGPSFVHTSILPP